MNYSNLHEETTTITHTCTDWKKTDYVDDLMRWVREAPTEKDARWNARHIVEWEIKKRKENIVELFVCFVMVELIIAIIYFNL